MAWATPQHSRSEVDRAGRVLSGREAGDLDNALAIIGNWRTSHGFPLNTLNRPGFDGGSISWRKMESCQTTPAATSPRIAIQLS